MKPSELMRKKAAFPGKPEAFRRNMEKLAEKAERREAKEAEKAAKKKDK